MTLGIGGWTARYLGPQNLGMLGYVAALSGLVLPFGSLGVKNSLSAMLCEEPPLPGLLGSALLIKLIGTIVIGAVLIPFVWVFGGPVVGGLMALSVVARLFVGSSDVFEIELLNNEQGAKLARYSTIQTIAGAVLSVLALTAHAPLMVFGGLPSANGAIRAWLLARSVQATNLPSLLRQAVWQTSRELMRRGWPLLLSAFSTMLMMRSDMVMLDWLRGAEEVGQYSVAAKVSESLNFLPLILCKTMLPRIGRGSGDYQTDLNLRRLYQSAWVVGLGMTLVSIFLLPRLVPLIFGDQYFPASQALIWLGPASFAISISLASGTWLRTQGFEKLTAQRNSAGALINIIINLFLIPRFGIVGAALATSVSYLFGACLIGLIQKDTFANFKYLLFPFRIKVSNY